MTSTEASKVHDCLKAIKEAIDNTNMAQPEKDAVTREMVGKIKIINDQYINDNTARQPHWD